MQDLLGAVRAFSFIPYIGPFMACGGRCFSPYRKSPIQHSFHLSFSDRSNSGRNPMVVGSSMGLPTVLTLAAALIGGNSLVVE